MQGMTPLIFRNLLKGNEAVQNTGVITVTAGPVSIVQDWSPTLTVGQWLWIATDIRLTKGGVAGDTYIEMAQGAGTAIIQSKQQALSGRALRVRFPSQPANSIWELCFGELFECTQAGSLRINIDGYSPGSNSSVAIGDGRMQILVFF